MKTLIKKITPSFLLNFYYLLWPMFGAFLYRFPSKKLKVIGVTGTNGKSTVVNLATKILQEEGYKTASLSSIAFKIGEKEWPNTLKMTMPGRFYLQRFLRQAVEKGCQYAVLEITSEGIKQQRHRFINFDVAVLTNVTPEHIEAHGSFEKYRKAKEKLFRAAKNIHIINLDDKNAEYFWQIPAKKKLGYRITDFPGNLKFQLPGGFNKYNALAAIYAGLSQGVSLENCIKALERIERVPGRMEEVVKTPFRVIVDYAHTPDALENVYKTITSNGSRLICVLGAAGGGRDKWKRPELGKIAAQYCSKIILTNEDPYDENPSRILSAIESGISNSNTPFSKIIDRRDAIKESLRLANEGDTVIITGKGSEPWMCVAGGKKISWDDRQIVREEFSK